jgi:hypothetical protein
LAIGLDRHESAGDLSGDPIDRLEHRPFRLARCRESVNKVSTTCREIGSSSCDLSYKIMWLGKKAGISAATAIPLSKTYVTVTKRR